MLFLYFQLASLVHVENSQHSETSNEKETISKNIRNVVFSLFNLRFSIYQQICPMEDMAFPVKQLLVILLKLSSIVNLAIFYFAFEMVKSLTKKAYPDGPSQTQEHTPDTEQTNELDKMESDFTGQLQSEVTSLDFTGQLQSKLTSLDFTGQLQIGFIKLVKLNYTSMCTILLQLVHCVEIRHKSHLYVHGDQVCYTWWQYVIFGLLLPVLVMFPCSFGKALDLLKEEHISTSTYLYTCVVPFHIVKRKNMQDS